MYNQWPTAPGRGLNYPRPMSITHLRTFSDNGIYVALQQTSVSIVSDKWLDIDVGIFRSYLAEHEVVT